ncbi:hypothetical protein DAEQUDRAFT_810328 [Daedalea quercina L-15889]|uniref:Uncharacterized protein n=1 Tax=Daedalea quercina L-15889 TaxID=1314783 RepID=A0A165RGI3_9APHY|nr:hypothetical protein DAEQUDRAFT_810328 [Daedalea quercina L-15889]
MAKKNTVSYPPKPQAVPMPASHSVIVGVATGANPLSLEDDEDDICPVCESECTCQNRSRPSQTSNTSASAASALSTSTFNGSPTTPSASASGLQSLKIKLTLPPNLKHRPHHVHAPSGTGVNPSRNHVAPSSSATTEQSPHPIPTGISAHHLALGVDYSVPKRRGRPPKAVVAAREAAKAALAAQNASGGAYSYDPSNGSAGRSASAQAYTGKGKHPAKYIPKKPSRTVKKAPKQTGKTTTARRTFVKGLPRSLSSADYSDDGRSTAYPTFVSAASSSSRSSSSESSDSESSLSSLDSDIEEETRLIVQADANKPQARKASGSDGGHKRWEIRPRQRSVGFGHEDADVESDVSSDGGSEASGEDTDNEGDREDDVDADTEGGGLEDVDLEDDDEETSSRIGITYSDGRGAGWSDDEESSFDADLFFANLDGSSDSDSSPESHSLHPFASASDFELSGSLSADEEDALFLMDFDPSVQVRRGQGEFEFGLELGELSFGWDGQVFFTSTAHQPTRDFGSQLQDDVEMRDETEDETQQDTEDDSATIDEVMLEESDGETTEDELIGPDGLPNSRAMMLFRWPTAVSTVDPQFTISQSASPAPQLPPDASESMRIALASYAGHQGSPAPTPADILAGRVSAEEMEEMEMERSYAAAQTPARKRTGGGPAMGEFASPGRGAQASAVIDGKGPSIPSPFPRSKSVRKRCHSTTAPHSNDPTSSVVETPSESVLSSTQSSEEVVPESQLETSDISSAEVIDLDDVLDASFLDSEPMSQEHEAQSGVEASAMSPSVSGALLSRWDRIPMATFRRTREINKMDGSASDTGLSVFGGLGSSIDALLTPTKPADKKTISTRRRGKTRGSSALSLPFDVATRDGERTPTSTSPQHGLRPPKKELRREKAMMKRKMMSKPLPPRHQAQFRTHNHHPNFKSRASGSMQRMNSFAGSSSPSFGL